MSIDRLTLRSLTKWEVRGLFQNSVPDVSALRVWTLPGGPNAPSTPFLPSSDNCSHLEQSQLSHIITTLRTINLHHDVSHILRRNVAQLHYVNDNGRVPRHLPGSPPPYGPERILVHTLPAALEVY